MMNIYSSLPSLAAKLWTLVAWLCRLLFFGAGEMRLTSATAAGLWSWLRLLARWGWSGGRLGFNAAAATWPWLRPLVGGAARWSSSRLLAAAAAALLPSSSSSWAFLPSAGWVVPALIVVAAIAARSVVRRRRRLVCSLVKFSLTSSFFCFLYRASGAVPACGAACLYYVAMPLAGRSLRAYCKFLGFQLCAFFMLAVALSGCGFVRFFPTDTFPLALIHGVMSALYALWVLRQALSFLQCLRKYVWDLAKRVALTLFAVYVAFEWHHSPKRAMFWLVVFAAVRMNAFAVLSSLGRRIVGAVLVRTSRVKHAVVEPVSGATTGGSSSFVPRRSARLAKKVPRFSYVGMA